MGGHYTLWLMPALDARALYEESLVWDMTLPYTGPFADAELLRNYRRNGVDYVSLTVATDREYGPAMALQAIARVMQFCRRFEGEFAVARTTTEIVAARAAGKMAIGFNLQGTNS